MRSHEVDRIAGELRIAISLLRGRLRQSSTDADLTFPELAALARIDRGGPATSADLARSEQISPQSMGATLAALRRRGLIARAADPGDGRRIILSLTAPGRALVRRRRADRDRQLAGALRVTFSDAELAQLSAAVPLLVRLAEAL